MGDGVRVPGFFLAIAGAILTAAILGGASAIVDTRVHAARLEERIARVEVESSGLRTLPVAIARLETKLDMLTDEVSKLRGRGR